MAGKGEGERVETGSSRLARSAALLLAAQVYYRAGGFVVFVVLSRTLAAADLGVYLFALACAEAVVVVASFDLDRVLMRRVALDPGRARATMASVVGFRLAMAVPYLAVVLLITRLSDWDVWPVAAAVAVLTLGDCFYLSFSCLFLAVDRVDLAVTIGVIVQTIYLGLVLAAMWRMPSLETFLVVCAVRMLLLIGAGLVTARQWVGRVRPGWDWSLVRESIPFAMLALVMVLQNRVDVLVVGWFSNYDEVAHYGLAMRVVLVALFVPMALGQIWYPHLSRSKPGPKTRATFYRGLAILGALGAVAAAVLILFPGPLAHLLYGPLGPEVEGLLLASAALVPLLYGVVFLGLALQALRAERSALAIFAGGAVVAIAAELALVPTFGAAGAVAARTTAAALQLVALLWVTNARLR